MNANLVAALWPQAWSQRLARVVLVAVGIGLLTASAKVQVPFWPVPMTLQTLAVLLIGASYGARLAAATVAGYLAAGAAGLPVFATGAGLAYMAGPTGGYLAGFLVAATLVGWLADRGWGRSLLTAAAMLLIGQAAIFALGTGWLAALIGSEKALAAGLMPFIPGEAVKTALAAVLLPVAWKRALG